MIYPSSCSSETTIINLKMAHSSGFKVFLCFAVPFFKPKFKHPKNKYAHEIRFTRFNYSLLGFRFVQQDVNMLHFFFTDTFSKKTIHSEMMSCLLFCAHKKKFGEDFYHSKDVVE